MTPHPEPLSKDIVERLRADYSILKEDYDALRADNERLRTTLGYLADNIDNPALVAVAEAALVERRALEPLR